MAVSTGIIPESLQGAYFEDPMLPLPQNDTGLLDLVGPSSYIPASGNIQSSSIEDKLKARSKF